MKLMKIEKSQWAAGLDQAANAYRMIGPVKEKDFHSFKPLAAGVRPDMGVAAAFNGLSTLGKTGNTMLFAHRTTHGAAFNDIQTMPVGATSTA